MTLLGFIDESGKISELFGGKGDTAVIAMVVMKDTNYALFKDKWMKELQHLFAEIFYNMASTIKQNPLELYRIENILAGKGDDGKNKKSKPKMELHTRDLVSKSGLFAFISSDPSSWRLTPFVEVLLESIDAAFILVMKRGKITGPNKCSDKDLIPSLLVRFIEKVIEDEDLEDDLFIMVIDAEPNAESPYSYDTVLEFMKRRFYGEISDILRKLGAISVFLSPSEWEPGIQAADLVAYIVNKKYRITKRKKDQIKEKEKVLIDFYNRIKSSTKRFKVYEMILSECSREHIEQVPITEVSNE